MARSRQLVGISIARRYQATPAYRASSGNAACQAVDRYLAAQKRATGMMKADEARSRVSGSITRRQFFRYVGASRLEVDHLRLTSCIAPGCHKVNDVLNLIGCERTAVGLAPGRHPLREAALRRRPR